MATTTIDLFRSKAAALSAVAAVEPGVFVLYVGPSQVQFQGADGDTTLMAQILIDEECYAVVLSDAPQVHN